VKEIHMNREQITDQAIGTALDALKDWASGKPAGQNVTDANAALDLTDKAGITAEEYRQHQR
jgi:hypothetical protein